MRGVALFKVGDDPQSITNATTRFLHDQDVEGGRVSSQMHDMVKEVFHGHLRSIIGGLTVEDLIANRNELAQQTRDASADEMQKLGLVVDSLQIQEIVDPTGYIRALGEPRAAEVEKLARIAQAAADREATEREQEAETLKAAAQRETAIKLAEFQAEQDRATATSAQAGPLAEAEAIAKRAEALEKESDAVIGQQLAEKLPEIVRAAAESFSRVDNLTILNGAQGVGEIMNQVIGQAGPALKLARETLGQGNGSSNGHAAAASRAASAPSRDDAPEA